MFEIVKKKLYDFWNQPVMNARRIVGIIILIMVVMSCIGELIKYDKIIYFTDWETRLFLLIAAWVIISANISKLAIGIFLLLVFGLSITLLIIPVNEIAQVVSSSIQEKERKAEKLKSPVKKIETSIINVKSKVSFISRGRRGYLGIRSLEEDVRVIIWNLDSAYEEIQKIKKDLGSILDDSGIEKLKLVESTIPEINNQILKYKSNFDVDLLKNSNLELQRIENHIGNIRLSVESILTDYNPDPNEKLFYNFLELLKSFLTAGAPFIFAMLMGALGSSIVITRHFIYDYEAQNPVWYIYRLTQGTVMALLIIYGLIAGMLSLGSSVEPIKLDEFDKIKYFIGFVSALAGLFSEQAFEKLSEISKTLFGQNSSADKHTSDASQPEVSEEIKNELNYDKGNSKVESHYKKSEEHIDDTENGENR